MNLDLIKKYMTPILRLTIPYAASAVRHFLVAGGFFEVATAQEFADRLVAVLCTLVGLGWSFYNASKKKEKPE